MDVVRDRAAFVTHRGWGEVGKRLPYPDHERYRNPQRYRIDAKGLAGLEVVSEVSVEVDPRSVSLGCCAIAGALWGLLHLVVSSHHL